MANDKLYITISNKAIDGGDGTGDGESKDKDKRTLGKYAQHQFFNLIKSTASKTANEAIYSIGNFAGDYETQRKVNELKKGLGMAEGIAMGAIAGFKLSGGNPIGAVVGTAIAVVGTGVSETISFVNQMIETQKTNYKLDKLRTRAGLNSSYDGSRGTEN